MSSNSIEWSRAKELLLNLAQALAPIPSDELVIPKGLKAAFAFQPRLFAPPLRGEAPFRHPVKLLTALQTARQEIDEILDQLPREKEPSATKTTEKQSTEKPIFEKTASFTRAKPAALQTEKKPAPPPVSPQAQRLIDQAQRLIAQVRDAIRTLSSSTVLANPREAPLKDVFERLKPLVDEMITAVAKGEMPSFDSDSAPPFRLPLPVSPREHLLKKAIPFPKSEPKPEKPEPAQPRAWTPQKKSENSEPLQRSRPFTQQQNKPVKWESAPPRPLAPEKIEKELPAQKEEKRERTEPLKFERQEPLSSAPQKAERAEPQQQPHPSGAVKTDAKPISVPPQGGAVIKPTQEADASPPAVEKTSLPALPFVPSGAQPISSSRKKKKRKGLWDKEEREEER